MNEALIKLTSSYDPNELESGLGSSLGLMLSKNIIEAHGGIMFLLSKGVGKGSTLGFALPLCNWAGKTNQTFGTTSVSLHTRNPSPARIIPTRRCTIENEPPSTSYHSKNKSQENSFYQQVFSLTPIYDEKTREEEHDKKNIKSKDLTSFMRCGGGGAEVVDVESSVVSPGSGYNFDITRPALITDQNIKSEPLLHVSYNISILDNKIIHYSFLLEV